MKVFLTGGTGFVGGRVARQLRARGDDVVALVRGRAKAGPLADLGCALVEGDLYAVDEIRSAIEGCDGAIHAAAMYEVGVPSSWRERMFDANVRGAERVLEAATEGGVHRIVHVSTLNVYGNTRGEVREDPEVPDRDDFLSLCDETKYLAHRMVERRAREGMPVVLAAPGAIYGPGDTSDLGTVLRLLRSGRHVPLGLTGIGLSMLHVDDAAAGIVAALDRGRVGVTYPLGGEVGTLEDYVRTASGILGRRPPRSVPTPLIRLGIPFGRVIGRFMGTGPNLRELVRVAAGVTYWVSDERSRREFGHAPRALETGLSQTLREAP